MAVTTHGLASSDRTANPSIVDGTAPRNNLASSRVVVAFDHERARMTEQFSNKYEEQAHQVVSGLEGTKWDKNSPRTPRKRTPSALSRYVRDEPFRAIFIAAGLGFLVAALRF